MCIKVQLGRILLKLLHVHSCAFYWVSPCYMQVIINICTDCTKKIILIIYSSAAPIKSKYTKPIFVW